MQESSVHIESTFFWKAESKDKEDFLEKRKMIELDNLLINQK